MSDPIAWQESLLPIAGLQLRLRRAGKGPPLLVLHRDTGTPDQLPAYTGLARHFELLLPEHPGYGQSERPAWMRSVRDLAIAYRWLLAELGLSRAALLGLGYGGWVAAEMASMAPADPAQVMLVGPMGIRPAEGEILDQALVSHIDYARAGFHDQAAFEAVYGAEPSTDQLVEWDICREMNFRLAWKPYMHSLTLPHLLGGVRAPTLILWGAEDRVVPVSAAEAWAKAMPQAQLERLPDCGHCVEMEKPAELLRLVTTFARVA
ncbi:alpha/beta fold hydrolase [Paracraurococcus lichenis]|uniref:Alpha/beta fold hydrolase n=1 Tax=Paracraurococcus lichenis TaxID=3064888 RepID=A0ABT9DSY8_9PROT|nr:alpha/beta fold hydrolase [Paracraurococcus sp. LOR1-02]MDO9707011.1 alpha/beta fold hydrolase [Paracraurococcus sp. LOR1-02]